MPRLGERLQKDRLGERSGRRAERTLRDAPENERLQAVGNRTHEGGEREARHAPDHGAALTETRSQPAGHRRNNGGGQDVEGHRPGDLVGSRRERPLHLRQDGRDDEQRGAVERRGQNDADKNGRAPKRAQTGPRGPSPVNIRGAARRLGGHAFAAGSIKSSWFPAVGRGGQVLESMGRRAWP